MNLTLKDKKHLWHPFTQTSEWEKENILVINKGKGNYLYDTNGRRYLDGISSLWCNVHGHQKAEIDKAIAKQLKQIAHTTMLGLAHPGAIELAEKLINIAPKGLARVFYSDSGATAVEIALKIAFQYWQQCLKTNNQQLKTKFLTFSNAYHGDTIGSVSLGGMDLFHSTYRPLLFKTIQAPSPYCYRCTEPRRVQCYEPNAVHSPFKSTTNNVNPPCLKKAEALIKKHHRSLAGVVIEPLIQGAAGMITQPKGFLKRLRTLCTKYNIILIADEVATGFGRTGRMFACEHKGVSPDIICIAKGITGGYLPLAATLTTEKIFKAFTAPYEENKTFFHGHTYTGNPLGCAAALANLKLFKEENIIERLQPKIVYLKEHLKRFYEINNVGDIRQCGMMVGIELVRNRATKEPYPVKERVGRHVVLEARKHGVILRPLGDVIVLMPPLSITIPELGKLLSVTYKSMETITG
ncbi:MAG: adenosylmethionine--8-amino-7-oxononanoate transaminase [Planctomycetes bacterium]|nr:adenosylmethionine--8-amino-7-oxononanoate transaminase [Planctomycetota bacterium]